MKTGTMAAVAVLLLAAGTVFGQTHAPWPTDWNNWNDPALWATVGNTGNTRDAGNNSSFGAVPYEYKIGKFEVTAGQYTEFLNRVAGVDTYSLYNPNMWTWDSGCKIERYVGSGTLADPYQYRVASDRANRPVNLVSFWDACRFVNWLQNGQPTGTQDADSTERGAYTLDGYNGDDGRTIMRNSNAKWAIPTLDEWFKAAFHKNDGDTGNYFYFATSSSAPPGRDMADTSGNNANHRWSLSDVPYPIDSSIYTTVVGEFQNSPSPYGTFDQNGNVRELTEAIQSKTYRINMGGSYMASPSTVRGPYAYLPMRNDIENVGFRIVEVPEPATLALLALGGLALVRRRWA